MFKLLDYLQSHGPADELLSDENIFNHFQAHKKFDEVDGVREFKDMRPKHKFMV